MVVYVEYALLENFILDGVLLWLALYTVKVPLKFRRIALSAGCGAIFSVVYPLLSLSGVLSFLLKSLFGALLCRIAVGRVKTRKEWGRYALSCLSFFTYTVAFGGALLAVSNASFGERVPVWSVFSDFAVLTFVALFFVKKIYAKRNEYLYVYDCVLIRGEKRVHALGFWDSGNAACKDGVPVCFVSCELGFSLWGEEVLSGVEPSSRLEIVTLGGRKALPLYDGEICVEKCGKRIQTRVYFAPSANIVDREYRVILNARTFDGIGE